MPAKAQEKLIFNTVHYPPYEIENPEDHRPGFDVELIQAAYGRLDIPIEINFRPWKRAIRGALNGSSTGIFSCSYRDSFHMSAPISSATDALFFRADFDFEKYKIETLKDLKKYPDLHVGGVAGYASLKQLDENEIHYETSPDDKTAFKKLFSERIDVFITTKEYAHYRLSHLGLTKAATYKPLKKKDFHICFSKSWDGSLELVRQFNEVLKELQDDGTYDAIHAQYR